MSSLSFFITNSLNSESDCWLASFSCSIVSETSPFPFILGFFLYLPIVCEILPVSLCFLSCSVLTPWVFVVKFCGRIPVRFCVQSPWSPDLTDLGLWFLLSLCMSLVFGSCWVSLSWVFPISWLSEGWSVPHPLVFYCVGVGRLCWSCFFRVYNVLGLFSFSCSVVCS